MQSRQNDFEAESKEDAQFNLPGVRWLSQKLGKDYAAYVLSAYAAIIYALGFVYFNQNNFSVPQTSLVRSYCILAFGIFFACKNKYSLDLKNPKDFRYVSARNLIMLFYATVITAAQFYIPLPIVFTINSIGPALVSVVDYFVNGVKVNLKQILGTTIGIIGILLVINGHLLLEWNNPEYHQQSSFENYKSASFMELVIIYLLLIISLIAWAYAVVITRQCTCNSTQINIYFGIIFILGSWSMYPAFENPQINLRKILQSLFWSGIPMAGGQFAFVCSLKLTNKTGNICVIGFLSIVVSYIVSVFRYGQKVNILCLLGTILTVAGVIRVVFSKQTSK